MTKLIEKYPVFFYFALTISLAWVVWIPLALHALEIIQFPLPIILGQPLGTFSVLVALFLIDRLSRKEISLEAIFQKIQFDKTYRTLWWLGVSAILLPGFTALGNLLDLVLGITDEYVLFKPEVVATLGSGLVVLIPVTLLAGLLSSPLLEEPGWRGFAIERLQSKYGHFLGSLILGSVWWLWHQPINLANGLDISLYSYLFMLVTSFTIDTVYFLTDHNLLSAMVMHSSSIVIFSYLYTYSYGIGVFLVSVPVIAVLRFYGYKKRNQPD